MRRTIRNAVPVCGVGLGIWAAPVAGQDTCVFDESTAANTAAEAIEGIEELSLAEERTAYERAWEALQVEMDGDNPVVFLFATQVQIGLDDFEGALASLSRFDELASPECLMHGDNWRYNAWVMLNNRGVNAYNMGLQQDALDAFTMSTDFHFDPGTYRNAALLQREMGNDDGAVQLYQDGINAAGDGTAPAQIQILVVGLGNLLMDLGRSADALAAYEAFLEDSPDDVVVRIALAGALESEDRLDEAQAIYTETLDRDDLDYVQWVQVGVGLFNAESFEQATLAFEKSRSMNPYSKEAMENLINSALRGDDAASVVALADTLVEWYPYDSHVYDLARAALASAGEGDRALEVMAAAEERDLVVSASQMGFDGDQTYVVRILFDPPASGGTVELTVDLLDASGAVAQTEVGSADAATGEMLVEIRSRDAIAGFKYRRIGS